MQQRVEATPAGRIAISVLCVAIVGAMVFSNLPRNSSAARTFEPAVRGVINTAGLNQSWNVFSPDPRRVTFELFARVRFADGAERIWRVPDGDPVVSGYRTYRWRKWVEWARADDREAELWEPTAVFVARQMARDGARPVEVKLVRRWHDLPPVGEPRAEPQWSEFEYYTLAITEEMLR